MTSRSRALHKLRRAPLAALITQIWRGWCAAAGRADLPEFLLWLETARPEASETSYSPGFIRPELTDGLDALDLILVAAVEEAERISITALSASDLEVHMRRLWSRTYARFASHDAARLERIFVTRGVAIPTTIYPDPARRRRLYQLGLPPAYAAGFEPLAAEIEGVLRGAAPFETATLEERYLLLERIAEVIERAPRFRFERVPTGVDWRVILRWWLQVPGSSSPPAEDVRDWLRVGTHEFEFRLGVAISGTLSLVWNRVRPESEALPDLDSWRELTGLPWSAFWLRELLSWGTLEPVTAYVIAAGKTASRLAAFPVPGSLPTVVGGERWGFLGGNVSSEDDEEVARSNFPSESATAISGDIEIAVSMPRSPTRVVPEVVPVIPSVEDGETYWFDGAGYHLATSDNSTSDPGPTERRRYDLYPQESLVRVRP